jgi:predicted Zn-dependent protease
MSENAPKQPPLSLPSLEEFSTLLRTMFINVGFFAATILLIPTIANQFTRTAIVIDPIAVPEALVKQGLTPEVVANRLWDGLQDFAATASANRETIAAIPDSQLIEFSLPDAGISIDSVFAQVRQFFQIYDTRIGGEFICATPPCAPEGLRLRLRVVRQSSDIIDLPEMGTQTEQAYFRDAAAGVYEVIDPYVAIAAQAETAPLKAATLARGLILDNSKDAKWAHNLVADIEARDNNLPSAIAEYRASLAIDPGFSVARAGLAKALFLGGEHEAARAELAELERRDPKNVLVPRTRATIALSDNDSDEAIRQLLLAAELQPLEPGNFTAAGRIELDRGNIGQGVTYLHDALSIDPGFGSAINMLAQAEADRNNLDEAVKLYRQWLEFEPDNLEARWQLGTVLHATGRYQEAIDNLQIAHDAGMRGTTTQMLALSLFDLKRFQDVITLLQPIVEADPTAFYETALLGRSNVGLGSPSAAIQIYEHYLAAVPADDPNRATIENGIAKLRAEGNQ